jgi:hypothetical protein
MLPMIAFAGQPPQVAKRIWLAINLVLLVASICILARVTRFRWEQIVLLALCGFGSLSSNFIYGQYYVFLLFLMTVTFYCLHRDHRDQTTAGGLLSGVAFGLKLYTGPFILYFAAKRKWRSVAGMAAASLGMAVLAVALFGWADVHYYVTQVLPRTLEGGSVDPYNPGNATLSTLLRRMFVREPELNPNPLLNAPWLFFFSRTVVQLGLLAFAVLGVALRRSSDIAYDFSWFIILLVLLSTSTASYTFILLLLPIALLLKGASVGKGALLLSCYILLNANLRPIWLFPKVWLLLLLFVVAGKEQLRSIPPRWFIFAGVVIVFASLWDARRHMLSYADEPGRRYPQIGVEIGALFSSYPAVSKFGLFYQGMGDHRRGEDRYVLCWLHDGRIDRFSFEGHALHPVAPTGDGPIWFELVRNRTSTMMRFDPLTRTAVPSPLPASATSENRKASPDGRWIAFTRGAAGSQQIWLTNVATGETEKLAGGSCNNASPTWELDSSAVIFASDCGRAFGLPALYRASNVMVARKQRSAFSDQLSARFRKLRKSHDRN